MKMNIDTSLWGFLSSVFKQLTETYVCFKINWNHKNLVYAVKYLDNNNVYIWKITAKQNFWKALISLTS